MNRVLIWGLGEFFKILFPKIQKEVKKGNIEIVAGVNKDITCYNHLFRTILPDSVIEEVYDYILISSDRFFFDIYNEAIEFGIDSSKLINGKVFLHEDFDFEAYRNNDWLTDNLFDNVIEDATYTDLLRIYKKKNLTLYLGRKSSIGRTLLEDGGTRGKINIKIGNFTNISWGGVFELGLNLDHDYNRVTNYGLTHLFNDYQIGTDEVFELDIGSDVWIGRNTTIKSGLSIGVGSVVASNSVVVDSVPPYAIVGGNPAKIIKYRFSREIINDLLKTQWWNWDTIKILKARDYLNNPRQFIERFKK